VCNVATTVHRHMSIITVNANDNYSGRSAVYMHKIDRVGLVRVRSTG